MGNGNAFYTSNLTSRGMRYISARHEAGTVAMADAYHRACGKVATATVTYGAGFTNSLTALAEAAKARIPMVLVVGDAPASGPRPWDIDQSMVAAGLGVRTITATAGTAHRADGGGLRGRRRGAPPSCPGHPVRPRGRARRAAGTVDPVPGAGRRRRACSAAPLPVMLPAALPPPTGWPGPPVCWSGPSGRSSSPAAAPSSPMRGPPCARWGTGSGRSSPPRPWRGTSSIRRGIWASRAASAGWPRWS